MTKQHCPECGCEIGASCLALCEGEQLGAMLELYQALDKAQRKLSDEIKTLMKQPGVTPAGNGLEAYWTQGEKPTFQGWQLVEDAALMPPGAERDFVEKLIVKYTKKQNRSYFNVRRSKPPGTPVHNNDPFI